MNPFLGIAIQTPLHPREKRIKSKKGGEKERRKEGKEKKKNTQSPQKVRSKIKFMFENLFAGQLAPSAK
jgi:hypothetical protein